VHSVTGADAHDDAAAHPFGTGAGGAVQPLTIDHVRAALSASPYEIVVSSDP
jgi:hypothetical protein